LLSRFKKKLNKLTRFSSGDNKDEAPIISIELFYKLRHKVYNLARFARGDKRDYAPASLMELCIKLSSSC